MSMKAGIAVPGILRKICRDNILGGLKNMKVLVINAGSSSLKYQLIEMDTQDVVAKGLCERIGIDGRISHKTEAGYKAEYDVSFPCHYGSGILSQSFVTKQCSE